MYEKFMTANRIYIVNGTIYIRRKGNIFNKWSGDNWVVIWGKNKLDPYLRIYTKIKLKRAKYCFVKKCNDCFKRKQYFSTIKGKKTFLNITKNKKIIKEKTKIFFQNSAKNNVGGWGRNSEEKRARSQMIFKTKNMYVMYKEYVCYVLGYDFSINICKKLLQWNMKKINDSVEK